MRRELEHPAPSTLPFEFVCHSFAGDSWRECRDYVRERLGLPRDVWKRERAPAPRPAPKASDDDAESERLKAQWLWGQHRPIVQGAPPWRYLREARGCSGPIPPTLGFLPARGDHPPAPIAAFGMAAEPKRGVLAIADADVRAVLLVKLKPDGWGKAGLRCS